MISPPNGAEAFPTDYLDYIATLKANRQLPMTELFVEPRDPAMALGRQGDENFVYSALIGSRKDSLFVILKFDSKTAYGPKIWQYCITGGAEWDVLMDFPTFPDLLHYLETEPPPQPPVQSSTPGSPQRRRRTQSIP
jgi:hypothetical protein